MRRIVFLMVVLLITSPLFAAAQRIAAPETGLTLYTKGGAQVAFSNGRFLTVWIERVADRGRIMGAFSDAGGRRITRMPFVIGVGGSSDTLELIARQDGFALFDFAPVSFATLYDLDADAHVRTTHPVEIQSNYAQLPVAWNGSEFLVVAEKTAVRLDADGRTLSSNEIAPQVRQAAVAAQPDGFVVVYSTIDALAAARVTADGVVGTRTLATDEINSVAAAPLPHGQTAILWTARGGTPFVLHDGVLAADGSLASDRIVSTSAAVASLHVTPRVAMYRTWSDLHTIDAAGERVTALENVAWADVATSDDTTLLALNEIHGQVVSTMTLDGGVREPLSFGTARQGGAIVAAAAGGALAMWNEEFANTSNVRAAAVQSDGTPFAPFLVSSNARIASKQLAWNGTEYLALLTSGNQWLAQRVTLAGAPAGAALPLGTSFSPTTGGVAWAGDRWVVLYSDGPQAMFATVLPNGTLGRKQAIALNGTYDRMQRNAFDDLQVVFDGDRGIVVWVERSVLINSPIEPLAMPITYFTNIDREGAVLDAQPVELSNLREESLVQSIAVAGHGRQVAIAADGWDQTRVLLLDLDGAPPRMRPFANPETFVAVTSLAWDGQNYVLATRVDAGSIRVRHLTEDAQLTKSFEIHPSEPISEIRLSVAATAPHRAIITLQETTEADGGRVVVYTENDAAAPPRRRGVRP